MIQGLASTSLGGLIGETGKFELNSSRSRSIAHTCLIVLARGSEPYPTVEAAVVIVPN